MSGIVMLVKNERARDMAKNTCNLCKKDNPSGATVCQACGAERHAVRDKSVFGKIKGSFLAAVAGVLFGWLATFAVSEAVANLIGLGVFALFAYSAFTVGTLEYVWVKKKG